MVGVGRVGLNRRAVQCYRIVPGSAGQPSAISTSRVISALKECGTKQAASLFYISFAAFS